MSCDLGNLKGGKCEWKRLASVLPQTADGLPESEGFEEALKVVAVRGEGVTGGHRVQMTAARRQKRRLRAALANRQR